MTRSSSAKFTLHSEERLLLTNALHTMDSGMVCIWYNIPLCTNFAQKSNGDGFRTKLGHFEEVPKSITHFEVRILSHSVLQSMVATRRPLKDPNHLVLEEWGCTFFQDSCKGNFKRLSSNQSAVRASNTSILLGQLNWSIQVVFKQAVWHWPV
ncbi:hypothetical protein O181_083082 [Austropuccinia psidii MF-1]|uniref:Uncharacterized protein n=1 Tax=Austropuccinia psidii MF-1 TaxID=1389203 RepID=A0A9Q3FRP7_9BASI|nr:hypothetical protein [Austropuccinia psidii MF-1]